MGYPLGGASFYLHFASEDSLLTAQPQRWAPRSCQPVSCPASPAWVGITLERLWGIGEKPVIQDLNSQGSTHSWSQAASGYEGSQRAELWATGRGWGQKVLLPAPSMGDWSRAAPLMEDVRLGFLIKLQCLFHLGPYFLKVAFLNHVLCLCGLETSLPTPHTSPAGLRPQTGPHEVPVVVQLQPGSLHIEVQAFLRWPASSQTSASIPAACLSCGEELGF